MPFLPRRSSPQAVQLLVNRPKLPDKGFSVTSAREALQEAGLSLLERPIGVDGGILIPEMPPDLDNAQIGELVRLQGEFTQLSCYLEEQVAIADADSTEADVVQDNVCAQVHVTKGGTVADRKAKVATDPAVVTAQTDSLTKQAMFKLLKAKLRSADKCISALSRAQSAKESELRKNL